MKIGIVPAGGLGSRMGLKSKSKEMLIVGGRPIIEYIFERLTIVNPAKIIVTLAKDKEDLINYLQNSSPNRKLLQLVVGPRRGLLDGIISPGKYLEETDHLYFGLPDTIWFPRDGFAMLEKHSTPVSLGLLPSNTPQQYGSVVLDSQGKIAKIIEKPKTPTSPWIWAFGRIRVSEISKLNPDLQFTNSLGEYAQSHPIAAHTFSAGKYLDIGTPENYHLAEKFIIKESNVG